jgi:hypothetical protein
LQYFFYENWHHLEKNIRSCEDTNRFVYLEHFLKDFDDQFFFSFVFFHICFIIFLLTWNQLMKSLNKTRMWKCSKDRLICYQIICYWLWARILDWKMIDFEKISFLNFFILSFEFIYCHTLIFRAKFLSISIQKWKLFEMRINIVILKKILSSFIVEERNSIFKI